jgi:hypothetical protein
MNNVSSARRLLIAANVVPSSPILVTLMMEALRSSETSVTLFMCEVGAWPFFLFFSFLFFLFFLWNRLISDFRNL